MPAAPRRTVSKVSGVCRVGKPRRRFSARGSCVWWAQTTEEGAAYGRVKPGTRRPTGVSRKHRPPPAHKRAEGGGRWWPGRQVNGAASAQEAGGEWRRGQQRSGGRCLLGESRKAAARHELRGEVEVAAGGSRLNVVMKAEKWARWHGVAATNQRPRLSSRTRPTANCAMPSVVSGMGNGVSKCQRHVCGGGGGCGFVGVGRGGAWGTAFGGAAVQRSVRDAVAVNR